MLIAMPIIKMKTYKISLQEILIKRRTYATSLTSKYIA